MCASDLPYSELNSNWFHERYGARGTFSINVRKRDGARRHLNG